jgi:tetratricopeptide (TPR) repeat protein
LRPPTVSDGVRAFAEGRVVEAERIFARAAESGTNVTALLYLGRIRRLDGRYDEAATALRAASAEAPDDGDVRRELGYLFLDLGRPGPAIEQFKRAQEIEPEEPLAWIGLIRALREAGDAEADEVLRRAPESVRSRMGAGSGGR